MRAQINDIINARTFELTEVKEKKKKSTIHFNVNHSIVKRHIGHKLCCFLL